MDAAGDLPVQQPTNFELAINLEARGGGILYARGLINIEAVIGQHYPAMLLAQLVTLELGGGMTLNHRPRFPAAHVEFLRCNKAIGEIKS